MIPKIIHYCWFGKGLIPHSQKKCIEGWKKLMPDYQFMRWDESTFNFNDYPLAKYAYINKKYAYVADICRFNVLSRYGGIYLDTDVEVFKKYDDILKYNFFTGIELYYEFFLQKIASNYLDGNGIPIDSTKDVPHLEILTSTIGCCPMQPAICEIRDYLNSINPSAYDQHNIRGWFNLDRLVARHLVNYGFKYKDETQYLRDNMVVFGTGTFGYAFCPNPDYSISYHHNAATWNNESWTKSHKRAVLFDKIGLLPMYKKVRAIFKRGK